MKCLSMDHFKHSFITKEETEVDDSADHKSQLKRCSLQKVMQGQPAHLQRTSMQEMFSSALLAMLSEGADQPLQLQIASNTRLYVVADGLRQRFSWWCTYGGSSCRGRVCFGA